MLAEMFHPLLVRIFCNSVIKLFQVPYKLSLWPTMPIVGCGVLPHGCLVLDATEDEVPPPGALSLHRGMVEAAEWVRTLQPDIILLSTPHGITLEKEWAIYNNTKAKGDARWGGRYAEFTAEIEVDTIMSTNLQKELVAQGLPVTLMTAFSSNVEAPLRWGEVVPLYFIQQALQRTGSSLTEPSKSWTGDKVKYVILTHPTRRTKEAATRAMQKELQDLGQGIASFFQAQSARVVILISGDLAHTHSAALDAPYPFSTSRVPSAIF
jgi:aromatic ring-opening dioxygenase LigB subunit